MDNDYYRLGVKRFLQIQDFYIGISSSALQIYKCTALTRFFIFIWTKSYKVLTKCYGLPLWNLTSTEDSDSNEENDSEISGYIVAALVHSEKP